MTVRTRIAPSPTGYMHIATLWIGLYNYFFAKKNHGKFILRVEDTDRERLVAGSVEDILDNFAWAGIGFDEGPTKNGPEKGKYGPYTQSERLSLYRKYVDDLLSQDKAYWCECSEDQLHAMREKQKTRRDKIGYDGSCREKELASGLVVRLKVPKEGTTTFQDMIRGDIGVRNSEIDDQVLLKSDGFPTYHLAVVVDDHLMKISHVIRGEEWIASTPKHILLYNALGWDVPMHAHLPLLLDSDHQKLSKRKGDVAVRDYRQKGYVPEAMVNFLALQGWNPSGDREMYTMAELIAAFDISKLNKSGSVVNLAKLDWLNGCYIRQKSDKELGALLVPYLPKTNTGMAEKIAHLVRERLVVLSDATSASSFIFTLPDYGAQTLVGKKSGVHAVRTVLQELHEYFTTLDSSLFKSPETLKQSIFMWIKKKKYSNGDVLWPLRVAVSGLTQSPPPFDIAWALGKDETVRRINLAMKKLQQ